MARTTRSISQRRHACASGARLNGNDRGRGLPAGAGRPRHPVRLDDIVAPVMREIRNPLATLVAASEMLAEELGPRHQCSGYARLLRQTSDRCHEALNDLAILAMPGNLRRTTVDLAQLIGKCSRAFSSEARRAEVVIRVACPAALQVSADCGALELCLTRLCRHSLAAMPDGGELLIRAGRSGGQAVIRVSDTGPAVPPKSLPRIFEPFAVAGSRRTEMRLAVCKSLITAHGGRVAARNRPEGGLQIEIRLPSGLEKLN